MAETCEECWQGSMPKWREQKKTKKNKTGLGKLAGGDTVAHMETHSIKKGSAINV